MRAFLGLRDGVHYRRAAFAYGLERLGYSVLHETTTRPKRGDLLCIWNRTGFLDSDRAAAAFEREGLPVLVAENGYLGNSFAGDRWYAISRNQHNGAGTWPHGGPERWDALGVQLAPFRAPGGETVLLPQRGIGPAGVAMPRFWQASAEKKLRAAGIPFRVRSHPGQNHAVPLEQDLARASAVVTWGSGAALKALVMGISTFHEMPTWIGAQDNTETGRLAMFRRLAWAQWRLSEIESGEAFRCLLS